jgi:uncharacterized membrane protein
MHSACVGVLVLASLTATALSAQNRHVQVWFKVTDTVSENIEGARISLRSSSGITNLDVTTGGNGMVETELEPGSYDVQVKSRIFKDWKRRIEVSNDPIQVISVIMNVDCDHSLCQMVVTADPPQPGRLEFHVTDQTGVPISEAGVRFRTAESTPSSFPRTDEYGNAAIEVPSGKYKVLVASKGFEEWNQEVVVAPGSHLSFSIVLMVAGTPCDPCEDFVVDFPPVEVDRVSPDVQIPLLPVKGLQIVGTKVPRKRRLISQ